MNLKPIFVGLAITGAALLLLWAAIAFTAPSRNAAKKAQADSTIADARTGSAVSAIEIRDKNEVANSATRASVKEATDEVERTTDPDRRDRVYRDRLCKLNPGACPD